MFIFSSYGIVGADSVILNILILIVGERFASWLLRNSTGHADILLTAESYLHLV